MAISTRELMELSLTISGMNEVPADSAIYISGSGLQKIMFGIDIEGAELMLAREYGCDAVVAHHPAGGSARLRFADVLQRQIEFMVAHGVDEAVAREATQPLITRATMGSHAANFDRVPSIARLLRMPFLNIHLPLDELGRQIMVDAIEDHILALDRAPTVQDAIDGLMELPEFANASTPMLVPVGSVDQPLGKYAVVHGAGTNGGARIAGAYFDAGVSTVLYIHCAGPEVEALQQRGGGNLIVSGHISSDLVGINRFIEAVEELGVEVLGVSGV